jgi:hypothetical protein
MNHMFDQSDILLHCWVSLQNVIMGVSECACLYVASCDLMVLNVSPLVLSGNK